ncbi:hypothetical protein [Streptomyces sp. NPDC001100]
MNAKAGIGGSYWLETAPPTEPPAPPPSHDLSVDVAVIGGGIMAGSPLSDLVRGCEREWSGLHDPRRLVSVVREGGSFLKQQAYVARHFVGDRLPPLTDPAPTPEDIPRGEGLEKRDI